SGFHSGKWFMEIWSSGTHLMLNGIDLSQLLKKYSELVLIPAGSLLIHDMRIRNLRVPNWSDTAGPNMAFYFLSLLVQDILTTCRAQYEQIGDRKNPRF
ncbi:MAG: hypothetical protein VYE00_04050, partial [Candidatus Poribacteria bacterium]|nr:hypothetical protein [Candidatus Poribacteria bacterium]